MYLACTRGPLAAAPKRTLPEQDSSIYTPGTNVVFEQHLGMDVAEQVQVPQVLEHRLLRSFGNQDEPTAARSLVLPSSLRRSTPRLAHNPDGQPGGPLCVTQMGPSSLPGAEQKSFHRHLAHCGPATRKKRLFFTSPNLRPCKFDLASTQPFPGRQPQGLTLSNKALRAVMLMGSLRSLLFGAKSWVYGYYTGYYLLTTYLHIATHGPQLSATPSGY